MKKTLVLITSIFLVLAVVIACEKKGDKNAIQPDYGATGNPNPNHQTVTGSNSFTNPATQNTALMVGDIGWSNLTCASTNSATLKANNGTTDVTINFPGSAVNGTYAVATAPAAGACAITILNSPNQPAGVIWVGKSGVVVVNTTTASINAYFDGVICTQKTFNFPVVTASGTLSCN